MKKICTFMAILMLSVLFVGTGNAQLFTEDFNYTGAVLGQNGWVNPGLSTTAPLTVSGSTGLSYVSGNTYAGSGVGGAVVLTTNGQDLQNVFTAVTTGSVYASAMVNVTSAQASGDYFFHFGDAGTSNFFGKAHIKADGTGFDFGVSKQKNSSVTDVSGPKWTSAYTFTSGTHLIVIKYTFVTGTGLDQVSLFVDPVIGAGEPGTPTLGPTTDNGNTSQASTTVGVKDIQIRQGNATVAPQLSIDGIRVGLSWSDVTPSGGSTTPALTATPAAINGLYYMVSTTPGATATSSYSLSGVHLTGTGNILVTAPTNFLVSLDGTTFTSTVNVPFTGPTLVGTTVYVRMVSGLSLGTYGPVNIQNAGGGVADMDVPVTGSVVTQTLSVSNFAIVGLSYVVGYGPSGASDYSLSGQYLTPATGAILITAPANFEVSLDNISFAASKSVNYGTVTAGVLASTPVYVRLIAGKSIGSYGPGNVTFAGGSAATQTVSVSGTVTAGGQLFSDDFSYALSSTLAGQGGWVAHSGAGTNPLTIVSGLSYTGLQGSGVGNAVSLPAGTGEDCNHQFTNINSGTVYASAMIDVVSGTGTDYVLHFGDADVFNFCARVYIKTVTGGYNIGMSKSSGVITYAPTLYTLGSTHLVVMKYNFVAGATNDFANLFIDPTPGGAEPVTPDVTTDNLLADQANISGIYLRQGGTSQVITVDGIKTGTTWASVTPGPSRTLTLTALPEAMYVYGVLHSGGLLPTTPAVTVEMHNSASPYELLSSASSTLSTAGVGTFNFTTVSNTTPYYLVVKSANTLETWSATAQSFSAGILSYNFTSGVGQAFTDGSLPPLALHSGKYCLYSGDCNQDGFITSADFTGVDNDGSTGDYHLQNDVDGNGTITSGDFTFIDNNGSVGVQVQAPLAPAALAKQVIKSHVQRKSSGK